MFEISDLHKTYENSGIETKAINGIDLLINSGEFVSIVGKSGSGKSTLMHMLAGICTPTSGTILVDGQNLTEMKANELADYRCKKTGFIFQSFNLETGYTVFDNVRLPLLIKGEKWQEHKKMVNEALKLVEMSHKAETRVAFLSGGEQQRVAIARAIVGNPSVIFADEPCGNLDSINSNNIMNLLVKLHSMGKTIVMVTHDFDDAKRANRIVELADGRVIKDEVKI